MLGLRRARSSPVSLLRGSWRRSCSSESGKGLNEADRAAPAFASLHKVNRPCSLVLECKELPKIEIPHKAKPVNKFHIPFATVACVRKCIEADDGALSKFLKDALGCTDLTSSPWVDMEEDASMDTELAGLRTVSRTRAQRSRYRLPMPDDVPDVVAKTLRLPKELAGATLNCIRYTEHELLMLQQSRAEGVMYSDRFRIQNLLFVKEDPAGGVDVCQWGDILWTQPLPWTHGFIGKIIEKRTLGEVKEKARDFAIILQEVLAEA